MTAKSREVTRRGFLATVGVGAAAAAIPVGALAAALPPGGGGAPPLNALQDWYEREIERLAEELRPRFEAGELRGNRESDFTDDWCDEGGDTSILPLGKLEKVVAERFGIQVEQRGYEHVGDHCTAHAILAASPSSMATDDAWEHPCYHARTAAARDVIHVARARGWYTQTDDEEVE